ncbi:MAG: hypothetical protein COV36_03120 [Alphaproteobacteria bacterium CG11_big_fil_rev_8_21_14_0_20_44_7]|nr:MAG: hypothetical protein COV36_03120 [Alphaproteobacteria bacterium CG11_big_fil_rev_8_21_14_0_20_44_7]
MEEATDPTIIYIIGGGILLLGGIAASFFMSNSPEKIIHKRAEKILLNYSNNTTIEEKIKSLRKVDNDSMLNAALKSMPTISRIREKLEKAGVESGVQSYLIKVVVYFIVALMVLKFAMGMGYITSLVIALFLGWFLPNMLLNRKIDKRMKKFMLLLPDALDLIVRGLRSGLPITESISVIAEEIDEPVRAIFGSISNATRLGKPFEESLFEAAAKIDLNEFNFFVISIALQRETGGNLAEILENLSETIRARAMMKMKIKAISSEARMSSYIVGSLPFLVSAALMFISPGYLDPLAESAGGNIALGVALTMFTFGMFVMRKMGNFEI